MRWTALALFLAATPVAAADSTGEQIYRAHKILAREPYHY